jgi:hypothetical protein
MVTTKPHVCMGLDMQCDTAQILWKIPAGGGLMEIVCNATALFCNYVSAIRITYASIGWYPIAVCPPNRVQSHTARSFHRVMESHCIANSLGVSVLTRQTLPQPSSILAAVSVSTRLKTENPPSYSVVGTPHHFFTMSKEYEMIRIYHFSPRGSNVSTACMSITTNLHTNSSWLQCTTQC